MAKKVTTLFIRDTSINLLVVKGEQVDKWASAPLEPGLVSQGLIIDEAEVADKLKQLFKETGANTGKVITALSGHDSMYRIITLPELPEAVLPEAIRREAKRTIPTPLEEVYFSYQRLPALTKGENRIFLVTFPRNLVDALIRTLRHAGVKPYIMDLAPLALCRIPDEPRAIILNARLDHLDVMVIADRLPQVIRRLSLPTEAESLEEKLPLIAEEFKRTVSFYNSSHIEQPLDSTVPVFISGEPAEALDTWESVVGQTGYSVSLLPSPVEPPEGFNPNDFMVNIGLALRELLSEKAEANFSIVNFNALPEAYVPPSFSILRVLVPVGTIIGVGLIIFAVILVHNTQADIAATNSELSDVNQEIQDHLTAIGNFNTEIEPIQDTAGALKNLIGYLEDDRDKIHTDLVQIVNRATGVNLGSVGYEGNSVSLSGSASDESAIFAYAKSLEDSGRFSVWVTSITKSGSIFNFKFSLTTK